MLQTSLFHITTFSPHINHFRQNICLVSVDITVRRGRLGGKDSARAEIEYNIAVRTGRCEPNSDACHACSGMHDPQEVTWRIRLAWFRTPPSQGGNRGSNPLCATTPQQTFSHRIGDLNRGAAVPSWGEGPSAASSTIHKRRRTRKQPESKS